MPFPLIAVLAVGLLIAAPGQAAESAGKSSQPEAAGPGTGNLAQVEAALAGNPGDPALRFRKGLLLAERKRNAEAVAVFSSLAREFPDSPEPYNNLAVLHAAAGRYEEARVMLDKAIRTSPAYAAVYDNLGGVHARLASQAYAKALGREIEMEGAAGALALVRAMQAPPEPAAAPSATGAPAAFPPATGRPVPRERPHAAIEAPSRPSLAVAAPAQPSAAEPDAADGRSAVLATVDAWAQAWSARDVPAYLAFYSSDFELPAGMSRQAWESLRHDRIAGKRHIEVVIARPSVTLRGDSATVQFRQTYRSDRFSGRERKTLVLVRRDGAWKIRKEWTGK